MSDRPELRDKIVLQKAAIAKAAVGKGSGVSPQTLPSTKATSPTPPTTAAIPIWTSTSNVDTTQAYLRCQ